MPKALGQLIRAELLLEISGDQRLNLKEHDTSAKLRYLTIFNVPAASIAFTLDFKPTGELKKKLGKAFSQLSCLISDNHTKANKSCDLVLISQENEHFEVVLADMKSERPKKTECKAQLRNSELYVSYLLSLAKEYHGVTSTPRFHRIIFYCLPATMAKPNARQRHKVDAQPVDSVRYIALDVGGKQSSSAALSYTQIF